MAKEFDREVVVYIWRFGGMLNPMHTGHVAVKLKAPEFDRSTTNGPKSVYISWWPEKLGEGEGTIDGMKLRYAQPKISYTQDRVAALSEKVRVNLANKVFQPQGHQKYVGPRDPNTNIASNIELAKSTNWGASADIKIRLPGTGDGGRVFGLDMVAMHRWWCVFSKSGPGQFSIMNRNGMNCSKAAYMVLRAGGATRFAKLPPHGVLNPNVIERWATTLRSRIDLKNHAAHGLEVMLSRRENYGTNRDGLPVDLLVPENWKKESSKNVSVFATRVGQVKKIDDFLTSYAKLGDSQTPLDLEFRVFYLDQILGLVQSYLSEKSTNKRADAILNLGDQAMRMMIRLNAIRIELLRQQKDSTISPQEKRKIGDEINSISSKMLKFDHEETWAY
jgi:hypothetical protein